MIWSMKVVTLTRGGQVSIPAEYRRHWPSNRVLVEETERGLLLRPLPADPIAAATGSLKGKGKPGMTVARAMAQRHAEDRATEQRKWARGRP
jgi:bifunctional DNA-binding transcriptional regulator/antitoxin component of YhaV-PrlF toxin-antitoxin module